MVVRGNENKILYDSEYMDYVGHELKDYEFIEN